MSTYVNLFIFFVFLLVKHLKDIWIYPCKWYCVAFLQFSFSDFGIWVMLALKTELENILFLFSLHLYIICAASSWTCICGYDFNMKYIFCRFIHIYCFFLCFNNLCLSRNLSFSLNLLYLLIKTYWFKILRNISYP